MSETSQVSSKELLFSIIKYSIATILNALIYGISLLCISWFVEPDVYSQVDIFASTTILIMNICILGMDQSFIRFFNEPPHPLNKDSLFGACFGFSSFVLLVTCLVCCIFFPQKVLGIFFADEIATKYLWMLFANAFFSMIGRYINILYRMDGKILLYTVESVANQFFTKLFFLFGTVVSSDFDTLVLFTVIGMAGFALVFLIPNIKRVSISPEILFSKANRQLLPYGLALAPTAIMLWLNSLFSKVYISKTIGKGPAGVFSMVSTLANLVALVQAGFATFWSAFIYSHYKTEQELIKQVHDYLTLLILEFFCVILAFEDIIFWILGDSYSSGKAVFPIMLLIPIFSVIQETTVYGISIAKKPVYDTIGIGLSVAGNVGLCMLLAPKFGIYGTCIALALANFIMFLFRTIIAQKLYCSIVSPVRTAAAIGIMFALTFAACVLSDNFVLKFAVSVGGMIVYIILYHAQLKNAIALLKDILGGFFAKFKA